MHHLRHRRAAMALVAAALLSLAGAAAEARPPSGASSLDRRLPMADGVRELRQVIEEVRAARRAGGRPVVVFDIDDTLVHWRKVDGVKVSSSPMPGAREYVRQLVDAGARVVYLTGRSEEMRDETRQVLRSLGVPLGSRHPLLMNSLPGRPIVEAKAAMRTRILALGTPVALFDNDLANTRMFRRQYPGARVFRVAGHSSTRDPEPQRGLDGVRVVRDLSTRRTGGARRAERATRQMVRQPRLRTRQRGSGRPRAR